VAAAPSGATILICPGTYPEQVVISQPLTLKGIANSGGIYPIVTVPQGGLVGSQGVVAQMLAQLADPGPGWGPVNISNLIVDGTGAAGCSMGFLTGIYDDSGSGTFENVEVRNQSPGGCGHGIVAESVFANQVVDIVNSSVHDFDDIGISAGSASGNVVLNLISNIIASSSSTVQAGVNYGQYSFGHATRNFIAVGGQTAMLLNTLGSGVTAKENTIIGSQVGIQVIVGPNSLPYNVSQNSLLKNGTGIQVGFYPPPPVIGGRNTTPRAASASDIFSFSLTSNTIVQSTTVAINLGCESDAASVGSNSILSAPVGIANVTAGNAAARNYFFSVPTLTTNCPSN
jgi:hypothetical protein